VGERLNAISHWGCTTAPQPRVLLFDFGSGESKWMVYSLTEHKMVEILEGEKTREVRMIHGMQPCLLLVRPSHLRSRAADANHLLL
jgi:hypothetical protein